MKRFFLHSTTVLGIRFDMQIWQQLLDIVGADGSEPARRGRRGLLPAVAAVGGAGTPPLSSSPVPGGAAAEHAEAAAFDEAVGGYLT